MTALRLTPEARQAREDARWAEIGRGRRRFEAELARCCDAATVTEHPAGSYAHTRIDCPVHSSTERGTAD